VTDDVEWCKSHLLGLSDVKLVSKSEEHDLALLSTCDHTIVDYGTFGFWGALMAGGHTMSLITDPNFNKAMKKGIKKWQSYDIKRFVPKKSQKNAVKEMNNKYEKYKKEQKNKKS
jgi:hypothetical protein